MHGAQRRRRDELGSRGADFQNVRLIFTNFLNFSTGVPGVNHQRGI